MKKYTKLSIQWFYDLLERGECDIVDFKEQLEDKSCFGKSLRNFSPNYEELARDVVAFANRKGGFLFIGIVDITKEFNTSFIYDDKKISELVRQIQDRTTPSITLVPHKLKLPQGTVLVLEIPFSHQIHMTSKGEYKIRSQDGNRDIAPHEMATIMSEKGMMVYDQKTWRISGEWVDAERLALIRRLISEKHPESPYLDKDDADFMDAFGMTTEEDGHTLPTTTGILFVGNDKALKLLPFYRISYIHYYEDGTYRAYEYSGSIYEMASACFNQLKAEIRQKEYIFGLFREYVEDYSEIVLREILINALGHRDISRQQIIQIRKYDDGGYMEFESPGGFPEGVTSRNYLRKTSPRNPNIMDVLREIGLAEKAGSGFDKIFTDLLRKGKHLPVPEETDTSVSFSIKSDVHSEKLIELSLDFSAAVGRSLKLDELLVLNTVIIRGKAKIQDFSELGIGSSRLQKILDDLRDASFLETTGRTSGQLYLLHSSRRTSMGDKISYVRNRKQEKVRQKEAILRYLDSLPTINNTEARALLKLQEKDRSAVSRLFAELVTERLIVKTENCSPNNVKYRRVQ